MSDSPIFNVENASKIALNTLLEEISNEQLEKLGEKLMEKVKSHHSIYTAMDVLSEYVKDGLINPTVLFMETDDEYDALMLWKSAECSRYDFDDFTNEFYEEGGVGPQIPQWKREILQTDQNDIEINKRQSKLRIVPESER